MHETFKSDLSNELYRAVYAFLSCYGVECGSNALEAVNVFSRCHLPVETYWAVRALLTCYAVECGSYFRAWNAILRCDQFNESY